MPTTNKILRLGLVCASLLASLLAGCSGPWATSTAPSAEEYHVIRTVIESLYLADGIPVVVLRDHTDLDLSRSGDLDTAIRFIQQSLGTAITAATIDDFRAKNRGTYALDARQLDPRCVLIDEDRYKGLFTQGSGWPQFYATYRESQGIMTVSRVGLSPNLDQALLYVGNQADYAAGRGRYIYLARKGEDWVIHTMITAWIS